MKTVRTILIMVGIVIGLVAGFVKEVFAPRPPGAGGSVPPPAVHHPPSVPLPLPMPSPQFFKKWSIDDVTKSFNKNGLEITNIRAVVEADYNSLPAKAEEGIKFSIPPVGEDVTGCILSFETKANLEKVKKHYLKLNKKVNFTHGYLSKITSFLYLQTVYLKPKQSNMRRHYII